MLKFSDKNVKNIYLKLGPFSHWSLMPSSLFLYSSKALTLLSSCGFRRHIWYLSYKIFLGISGFSVVVVVTLFQISFKGFAVEVDVWLIIWWANIPIQFWGFFMGSTMVNIGTWGICVVVEVVVLFLAFGFVSPNQLANHSSLNKIQTIAKKNV